MRKPWREMTEAEKEKRRETVRRYYQNPEARAKRLARHRKWNEMNKERKKELDHQRWIRKKNDDPWMANKVARITVWKENNRHKVREYFKKWKINNQEKIKEYQKKYKDEQRLKMARTPELYAEYRRKRRDIRRRKAESLGKTYTPRPARCIPDYLPFGVSSYFATRSTFVRNNLSDNRLREIDGYARDLAIERNVSLCS